MRQLWSNRVQELLEPFNYIASSQQGGETLQALLVEAFNVWMQVAADKLEQIKTIVFMLHNASLL
jgi:geranylgeranyl pyrophosphate synthase